LASEAHGGAENSTGFPWASSLRRSAPALPRLGLRLALTTRALVAQGPEVVQPGQRRGGAPQWFRGQSDMQLGGPWVKVALRKGVNLCTLYPWPVPVPLHLLRPPRVHSSLMAKRVSLASAKTLHAGYRSRDVSAKQRDHYFSYASWRRCLLRHSPQHLHALLAHVNGAVRGSWLGA